jgi:hypothetical protein
MIGFFVNGNKKGSSLRHVVENKDGVMRPICGADITGVFHIVSQNISLSMIECKNCEKMVISNRWLRRKARHE